MKKRKPENQSSSIVMYIAKNRILHFPYQDYPHGIRSSPRSQARTYHHGIAGMLCRRRRKYLYRRGSWGGIFPGPEHWGCRNSHFGHICHSRYGSQVRKIGICHSGSSSIQLSRAHKWADLYLFVAESNHLGSWHSNSH